MRPGSIGWAVAGGIVAAMIDIGAAAVIYRVAPDAVARSIAGGILGPAAASGDASTAALGLTLQVLMGALIGAIYAVVHRSRVRPRSFVATGLLFGVAVFVVMNYVVMPLSAYRRIPRFGLLDFSENLLAMLCFGLIVASVTAFGSHQRFARNAA